MNISCDKEKMVFKYTRDDKEFYSIGLSKKNQNGGYDNGFVSCRFKKDVKLENQTKIMIKEAWVDFYTKDKKTYPYIFINKFDLVNDKSEVPNNTKTDYKENDIVLKDEDLPF